MMCRNRLLVVSASAFMALAVLALPVLAAGCPPGSIQIGVRDEVTATQIIRHPICRLVSLELSAVSKDFCSAKQSIPHYQEALRALNLQADVESFERFQALGEEQVYNLERTALLGVLSEGIRRFSKNVVQYLGHYSYSDAQKAIVTLKSTLRYENLTISELLYKLASATNKRKFLQYSRKLILSLIESTNELIATAGDIKKDPDNVVPRFLLGVLQIAQANPELSLLVTEIEMMESYAYLAWMPSQFETLTQLSEEHSRVAEQAIAKMRKAIAEYKKKKELWHEGGMGGEPYCATATQ